MITIHPINTKTPGGVPTSSWFELENNRVVTVTNLANINGPNYIKIEGLASGSMSLLLEMKPAGLIVTNTGIDEVFLMTSGQQPYDSNALTLPKDVPHLIQTTTSAFASFYAKAEDGQSCRVNLLIVVKNDCTWILATLH